MTTPTPVPTPRKLGPGVLSIGSAGSVHDVSKRCKSVKVTWAVNSEDNVQVLSGDTESGDTTYTPTLEATLYQDDLVDGSFIRWSWTEKGNTHPFSFTPYAGGVSITGDLTVSPLDVGGDVGKKNDNELKWTCTDAEFTDDLS